MNYEFAKRVSALQPSAIREILKFTSDPKVISFAAGNPAPEAFPVKEVTEIVADIFAQSPVDALQYSLTEGYPALRQHLTDYLKEKQQIGREFDQILITSGAQQVMDLAAKSLLNEGDIVVCEDPSFIGSLNTFRSYGLKLKGVEMDPDGMNLEKLEQILKQEGSRAKLIYTIPNFHNPTGITMSLEKRRGLYALAKQYGLLIIEDNPYGDIRFEGQPIPAIKSLDEDGIVIYAGSFSKVLSPGMRVGFAVAPAPIISKMTVCKQTSDVHTNILSQMIAHRFMTEYDYEGHLMKIREIYRHKSSLMMNLIDQKLHGKVTYHPVQGGLFIWGTLPEGSDMLSFCSQAVQRRVALVPGTAFLADESGTSLSFRMNYSTPTDDQLCEGMEILGQLVQEIF